jgi:hypothetical protein
MNKFVTGALALAVAGSAAYAEPPNSDWLELDSEINTLASSVAATGDFANIKMLLRGGYTYGSDGLSVGLVQGPGVPPSWSGADDSNSAVRLWDAEISGSTTIGEVQVRLGMDFARLTDYDDADDGPPFANDITVNAENFGYALLQDAYAMWDCGYDIDIICGRYKPHVTRSGYTDPEQLFFLERSVIGSSFDWYDQGIGARGIIGDFAWNVDVMNGPDDRSGLEGGHLYILHALWNFGREPGNYESDPEDANGAGDEFVCTVGAFYQANDIWNREGTQELDTDLYGIDFQGTYGQFGFGLEIESRDDHTDGHYSGPGWNALLHPLEFNGDSMPWMVYGTYMINDQWGVGLRYEDLDNGSEKFKGAPAQLKGADNTVITAGVNMYDVGHNGKLGANIALISDDRDDTTVFQVGYTYGASR